ncbi:MAG: hypothetical protein Q8N91_05145 [Candidatus Omnitrophota bacterium]|nr:hypothetical protein [Candidatus Omnitrophota bacterium]
MSSKNALASLNPDIKSVFIENNEKINESYYYPLFEIVLITLLKYHTGKNLGDLQKCFNDGGIVLSRQNIDAVYDTNMSAYLIFSLIPKVVRYDPNERVERYALIQKFLIAA